MKEQSKQWTKRKLLAPKEVKTVSFVFRTLMIYFYCILRSKEKTSTARFIRHIAIFYEML